MIRRHGANRSGARANKKGAHRWSGDPLPGRKDTQPRGRIPPGNLSLHLPRQGNGRGGSSPTCTNGRPSVSHPGAKNLTRQSLKTLRTLRTLKTINPKSTVKVLIALPQNDHARRPIAGDFQIGADLLHSLRGLVARHGSGVGLDGGQQDTHESQGCVAEAALALEQNPHETLQSLALVCAAQG